MNISILDQKSAKIVNWPPRYLGTELMIYLFLLWSSESGVREDTLYKANEGLRLVEGGVLLVYVHQQLPLSCRNRSTVTLFKQECGSETEFRSKFQTLSMI